MKKLAKHLMMIGCLGLLQVLAPSAEAKKLSTDEPVDSVQKKTGWWTIGAEVANNSSFFGRNTATRYPYAAATVTYVHNTGIWGSVTSYQLFDTESYIDETDVSVGYSFMIKKVVEANVSYSRFIFGENTPLVNSFTSNALSARTALDWGILYTALSTSYVFGESNDVFTVLENSRFIPLNPLWGGRHVVGLDPKITVTAGTQRFYETHTTTTKNPGSAPGSGGSSGGNGPIGGTPIGGTPFDPFNPGGGNNNKPGNGGNNNGGTTTTSTTTEVSKFNILNYDFKIPAVIYLGNFEIEPSYRYSIPVNKIEGDESKAQSFYSLSVNFTF